MKDRKGSFQPIFVIGAARSGTNMLRDILTQIPNTGTWNCDEINPIWRHGNLNHPNDVFTSSMVNPNIKRYIRRAFTRIAHKTSAQYVIEKTCANSLRVPFINKIFPNGKYIFIIRDGRDTVASASIRWNAPFELIYTLKKLRYIPIIDIPFYAYRFGWNRIKQVFSNKKQLSFWGVQIEDIQEHLKSRTLSEVCALQWKECVEASHKDLSEINGEQVLQVRYEEFVNDPKSELTKILNFIGMEGTDIDLDSLVKNVKKSSVGKYQSALSNPKLSDIEKLIDSTLIKFNYK